MSRDKNGMNCRDRAGRELLRKANEQAAHYERKQSPEYVRKMRDIDELKRQRRNGDITLIEYMHAVFAKGGK